MAVKGRAAVQFTLDGRCRFDSDNTDLFFDIIDRRSLKEGPSTTIFTSNTMPMDWGTFFERQDCFLCTLDRVFDKKDLSGTWKG